MKKNKEIVFMIMAIICIIIFAVAMTPITLQNDTFYTIKIGQYIMENGIGQYDPFSWHEELPYTFPHWAYDVLMANIYNIGGLFGIYVSTAIFTIILSITWFLVNCKLNKNKLTSFILTLAFIYLMAPYIAARAQLVTFTIFLLEVFFIERFLQTKKKRFAIGLIILPIIIANIHSAVFPFYFVLFMPYIGEYIISLIPDTIAFLRKLKVKRISKSLESKKITEKKKYKLELKLEKLQTTIKNEDVKREKGKNKIHKLEVEKNKNVKWLIIIMLICVLTGFMTPLGDTPYTYLVKTMQGNTTQSINEHLPLVLIAAKPQLITITLFFAILIFTDVKIRLKDLFMLGGLLLLSLMQRRQLSMFMLIGLITLNSFIVYLANKYDKDGCEKFIQKCQKPLGILAMLLLVLVMCIPFIKEKINNRFIDETEYPVAACDYIIENLDLENLKLYNEYNFGSYLIFRNIPVFVDSRADLYTPQFDTVKKRDIFSDFMSLTTMGHWYEDTLSKYPEITHLFIYKNCRLDMMVSRDSNYNLLYEDNYFRIYEKLLEK